MLARIKKRINSRSTDGRPYIVNFRTFQNINLDNTEYLCYNKCTAFINFFNVLADMQIKDLLPAYRTIIA